MTADNGRLADASLPTLVDLNLHAAHLLENPHAPADRPPFVQVHLQRPPHRNPAGDRQPLARDVSPRMRRQPHQEFGGRQAQAEKEAADQQAGSCIAHESSKLQPAQFGTVYKIVPHGAFQLRLAVVAVVQVSHMHDQDDGVADREFLSPT